MVSCKKLSTIIEVRMESGIETAMIERAAPAPQEQQDHQPGQARGDDSLANYRLDRGSNEQGLVRHGLNL